MDKAIDEVRVRQYINLEVYGKRATKCEVLRVSSDHESDDEKFNVRYTSKDKPRRLNSPDYRRDSSDRQKLDASLNSDRRFARLEERMARVDAEVTQICTLSTTLEALTKQMTELARAMTHSSRPRSRSPSPGRTQCFGCGEVGHFRKDCPQRKTPTTPEKKVTFSEGLNEAGSTERA
ncbi:uncharacterized protein [Ptychodera flava]|uniref:uncharacterized protein n=1 Tax=Ptychodera flava TaxID=63121 RepID=UPI00396A2D28